MKVKEVVALFLSYTQVVVDENGIRSLWDRNILRDSPYKGDLDVKSINITVCDGKLVQHIEI